MLINNQAAVELISRRLDTLPHDDGLIRLTMFNHDSPGLRTLRRNIAEALVALLEGDPEVMESWCLE